MAAIVRSLNGLCPSHQVLASILLQYDEIITKDNQGKQDRKERQQ
jgi:hypothetical protein